MSGSCSSWKWPKMRAPVSRSPSSQGKHWGSLSCSSRKREDFGDQLLEDLARIVEDVSERAIPVGLVNPGVDLVNVVLLIQFHHFCWPGWCHVSSGIERCSEAQHRSPAPPGYVGNDILDRPASCDLRLRHVLLANLVEQCQPCRLLALHLSEKLLFAD